jgi:hypothetical protein
MDPGNPISLKKSFSVPVKRNIIAIENNEICSAMVYPLAKPRNNDAKNRINEKMKRARKICLVSMIISSQSSHISHSFCALCAQQVAHLLRTLDSIWLAFGMVLVAFSPFFLLLVFVLWPL